MSSVLVINEIQIPIYVTVSDSFTVDEEVSNSPQSSEQLGKEGLLQSYQGLINVQFK